MILDIQGYEGRYAITDDGRVWSYLTHKYLKPGRRPDGYLAVILSDQKGNRKNHYIHRLVAMAFIPNPLGLEEVNHKDEDKGNNSVENLEWISKIDNLSYGTRSARVGKGHEKPVEGTNVKTGKIIRFPSEKEACKALGIERSTIERALNGRARTGAGYVWKFAV